MSAPLMTSDWLEAALGTKATSAFHAVDGVSIDTRTLVKGDLFVALPGEQRDGHEFVALAFEKGASAALVQSTRVEALSSSGPLLPVPDVLPALEVIGQAARARVSSGSRIVAVTGSVGKTGTKEALRFVLSQQGRTHASVASYNNHFGVPLTLARMRGDTQFGVFEIGMNHAGEIEPLARQVKPHVALITTVEAVHIENFLSVEAIADEKAAIFKGVVEGGTAVINRDNPHYERLWTHASRSPAARVISFGENPAADIRLAGIKTYVDGSDILAEINGVRIDYHLGSPGRHLALNSLGVLGVVLALGGDVNAAALALRDVKPPSGRGSRFQIGEGSSALTVIDESYNANPASMRAAFALLKDTALGSTGRRVAILGDMLELGKDAEALHAALADDLDALDIDVVHACGPLMRALYERLPVSRRGLWHPTSEALAAALPPLLHAGDVLMVKGSNGSRMAKIMAMLKTITIEDHTNQKDHA